MFTLCILLQISNDALVHWIICIILKEHFECAGRRRSSARNIEFDLRFSGASGRTSFEELPIVIVGSSQEMAPHETAGRRWISPKSHMIEAHQVSCNCQTDRPTNQNYDRKSISLSE